MLYQIFTKIYYIPWIVFTANSKYTPRKLLYSNLLQLNS
jgi:hypothetical protein